MTFYERLAALGFETYEAYLQGEHWQEFRNRYRASAARKCEVCGNRDYDLHHTTYKYLGCERFADITPLCRKCHEDVHKLLKDDKKFVSETKWAIAVLKGRLRPMLPVTVKKPQPVSKKKKKKTSKHIPNPKCSTCSNFCKKGRTQCGACDPLTKGPSRAAKKPKPTKPRVVLPPKEAYKPNPASLFAVQAERFKRCHATMQQVETEAGAKKLALKEERKRVIDHTIKSEGVVSASTSPRLTKAERRRIRQQMAHQFVLNKKAGS